MDLVPVYQVWCWTCPDCGTVHTVDGTLTDDTVLTCTDCGKQVKTYVQEVN